MKRRTSGRQWAGFVLFVLLAFVLALATVAMLNGLLMKSCGAPC